MPPESLEGIREKFDTPAGKAAVYNILRLKDLGYDVERLPYSIRVLLENLSRHSNDVQGALEGAHRLANWPESVGEEIPFMPYRVLLQDYTGVPLIVDLSAMRDAAKAKGIDPRRVNSQVPVDLVIDHSIQVDAWGNDMAFSINLEKEYERNSERYQLLKWAQSSFENLRVFPPGKGICHQFNLEYLSQVVATSQSKDGPLAFPDTLVGTDSHTTMVNGLGCLGWGVGGIEAEAVMLGEPYHMPIPRVLGVKLMGQLREGVTPTDLVLTVTELLREKNVVGAFVEYFGEGYGMLSVPDRATIGNMSPEYGATSGFCPVDDATLAYLMGTARPQAHVKFVGDFSRKFGFFADGPEPRYSEVLEVDMDAVEPSVAGPRNPEERRTLRSMHAFAPTLYSRPQSVSALAAGSTRSQLMMEEDGPIRTGLRDGSVVIAAITSCTNTSNPTVMVGAGLIAKKAVDFGLQVKPWVKPSLAPGSTVVTDYLSNSGLLEYLDRLGFALVGYGCTTCIVEGTPVLLSNGTTSAIDRLPLAGGSSLFSPTGSGKLAFTSQSALMDQGFRECVTIVLQDGRTLVCTPDHELLCSDGRWVRADQLELGKDRVVTGPEAPLDTPGLDENGYALKAGGYHFNLESGRERSRFLAFSRLLGFLLGDGSISVHGQGRISVGQKVDREAVLNDVELITGLRPAANRYDERRWSVVLPSSFTQAMSSITGVQVGKRINQPATFPEFVLRSDCPVAVVREFLAGLFGADGHSPILKRWGDGDDDLALTYPAYSRSVKPEHLNSARRFMEALKVLLARCGVHTSGAKIYDYPTRRSRTTYREPSDGIPRIEVRLELGDGLSFVERIGYRFCADKMLRASAAAVYWRTVEGINKHRLWISKQIVEIHSSSPELSFAGARQVAVHRLLGNEQENSLPPVVSPHYAFLEGHDRFARLPSSNRRRFRPYHRASNGFPSPAGVLREIGARSWFSQGKEKGGRRNGRHYSVEKESDTLPTFTLQVVGRRSAGVKHVYDISVDGLHSFLAGTVAVHNCIGNSGPLSPEVEETIKRRSLYSVAVLSGNRNFDGRIHPLVKGSFLMSPMLVVAYSLAGSIDFDFSTTPLGTSKDGRNVFLKDLWPNLAQIKSTVEKSLSPELYQNRYSAALKGDERWESLTSFTDDVYHWSDTSTYIKNPPWFESGVSSSKKDIHGARALALFEDKVTTDHISPAGTIQVDSPAGTYLTERGVDLAHLSTYGSRRGNHEVMVRGGFSNIRLRNLLAKGNEGGFTSHFPDGTLMTIYDAAMKYRNEGVPLIVIAGRQYGAGSSRDWAAKAPLLLGVKAVIAESFERIHRSNLVAMGVVPLQFKEGEGTKTLGLTGAETYDTAGLASIKGPKEEVEVRASGPNGTKSFRVICRVDNETEMRYIESGGVLPYVFEKLHKSAH